MDSFSNKPVISQWNALGLDLRGKVSGQIKLQCPFCRETRKNKNDPSLSVQIDTGMYNCHHCGASGNIHRFRASKTNKVYQKPVWKNHTKLSEQTVKWFESRKISQEALEKMKVTETMEYMPQVGKECPTICFNYFENGELVNIKYRDQEKHFKMFKDGKPIWYNIDRVGDTVIIVEGEMDALSFITAGWDSVISVPNGASNWDFFDPEMFDQKKVILAVDQDEPGLKLRKELIRRIGAERCSVADFKDCKDANEYLIKYGRQALLDVRVTEVPIEGVVRLADYRDDLWDLYHHGLSSGATTRHPALNNLITYETGRLMVVTGIPGHGKSEWVDDTMVDLATLQGWKTGFFSPENFPICLHASKLIAKLSGRWIQNLSPDDLNYYSQFVDDYFFWVLPEDESYTLDAILSKAFYLVRKYGIKAFVIDPWNTLEQTAKDVSETQFVSQALGKITNFARQHDVLMVLVAHPRKMEKNSDGEFEVPNLYSISGSAHFYNKADYGVTVYRNLADNVQLHVQKVKFRHLGQRGMVEMRNNPGNGRYQESVNGIVTSWRSENYIKDK